jgi:hypothetical protein
VDVTAQIILPISDGICCLDQAYPSSVTLGHVMAAMLTISDDIAVRPCGLVRPATEVNDILRAKGLPNTQVQPVPSNPHRMFFGKTTPREMHNLLQGLVKGTSAEAIEPSLTHSSLSHVAVWGWLNLGAAAAAARNNRPDAAGDAIRRARAAAYVAAPHRKSDVAHWTTLSPAVVAIREAELAMVAGDPDTVLRAAQDVPADTRPAVTYQRHLLDVAAAHLEQRRQDETQAILLQLCESVPGWLRYQRLARSLTVRLLHGRPRTVPVELRELADFLDVVG